MKKNNVFPLFLLIFFLTIFTFISLSIYIFISFHKYGIIMKTAKDKNVLKLSKDSDIFRNSKIHIF